MNHKNFLTAFLTVLLLSGLIFAQDATTKDDPIKSSPTPVPYQFPTAKKRFMRYVDKTVGPVALLTMGAGAGLDQFNNVPPEWEKTASGYGRRFASNFGQNVVRQTTQYALAEAFGQDMTYQRCECRKITKRTLHALKSGLTAKNRKGKRVFSPAKVVSPFVGSITATTVWFPERHGVKDGLRRGTRTFAFSLGFNLLREFIF